MPASGPVYQPTTVSYEQHGGEWAPRNSYLPQTVGSGFTRVQCFQWLVLVLGLFAVAAGLLMAIEGTIEYHTTESVGLDEEASGDLIIAVSGALLLLVGLILLAGYASLVRRRKGCPCFPSKEQRLARQLRDGQGTNGQILTLGPSSTDMLVTAQYGPVSEIAYQPPAIVDEEETRKLMDHKESLDENERMLEQDPRIVLRPLCAAVTDSDQQ